MELHGTIQNGVVVFDNNLSLPNGTRVRLVVEAEEKQPTLAGLLKYAGVLQDMPIDFAQQHDHYIHRTPKK